LLAEFRVPYDENDNVSVCVPIDVIPFMTICVGVEKLILDDMIDIARELQLDE
jgi:hypothetical protein